MTCFETPASKFSCDSVLQTGINFTNLVGYFGAELLQFIYAVNNAVDD